MNDQLAAIFQDNPEGFSIEGETMQMAPLSERKQATQRDTAMLIPLLRVSLGNTVLREMWIRANRNTQYKEVVDIGLWAKNLLQPQVLKFLHKRAAELNFFKRTITKVDGSKETISDVEPLEKYLEEGFARTRWDEDNPTAVNVWVFVRAASRVISLANYRNWMQFKEKGQSPFRYNVDSDHKIVQQMVTGITTWKHPSTLTFSWTPAETEEDFLRPFSYASIPNPENPEETISIKVYRGVGNAYKFNEEAPPESNSGAELITNFMKLGKGEHTTFEHPRTDESGNEIRIQEFRRAAEGDLAMLERAAQDAGISFYSTVNEDNRTITVFHAGWESAPVAVS